MPLKDLLTQFAKGSSYQSEDLLTDKTKRLARRANVGAIDAPRLQTNVQNLPEVQRLRITQPKPVSQPISTQVKYAIQRNNPILRTAARIQPFAEKAIDAPIARNIADPAQKVVTAYKAVANKPFNERDLRVLNRVVGSGSQRDRAIGTGRSLYDAGKTIGTGMTFANPIRVAQSGALGVGTNAVGNIFSGKKVLQDADKAAIRGVENAWLQSLSEGVTDALALKIDKTLTNKAISSATRNLLQNKQYRSFVALRLKRALLEVGPEALVYGVSDASSQNKNLVDSVAENFISSIATNLVFALGQSGVEIGANELKPIVSAVASEFSNTLRTSLKDQRGFIDPNAEVKLREIFDKANNKEISRKDAYEQARKISPDITTEDIIELSSGRELGSRVKQDRIDLAKKMGVTDLGKEVDLPKSTPKAIAAGISDVRGTKTGDLEARVSNKDVDTEADKFFQEYAKKNDKYAGSINKNRLIISDVDKQKLDKSVSILKPELEKAKGGPLTDKEVIDAAKIADPIRRISTRSQQAKEAASILALRQDIAKGSQEKGISKDFLKNVEVLSSIATEKGRALQKFNIGADPESNRIKEEIARQLIKNGEGFDTIVKASKDVDFDNPKQVQEFYRKFVTPSFGEVLDEYRYINLLSSPKTHIVNATTNLTQAIGLRPATKLVTSGIDYIESSLTGNERKVYASEVPAYYKGVFNNIGNATKKASQALQGDLSVRRPDINSIPTGSKLVKPGMFVLRALEAGDIFFRTLVEAGEIESAAKNAEISGKDFDLDTATLKAREIADYELFRSSLDPSNKSGQGNFLSAIDGFTDKVYGLRETPGVKYFIPFVQTPMNILKQGFEYSPAGVLTLKGAENKEEQIAKAIIGSIVTAGAATVAYAGDSTWAPPVSEKEKELFYASGRKPYSIRIGDEWVSYSKLGPLAYPIALAAAAKWYFDQDPKAVTDKTTTKLGKVISGFAGFFSDQSYMQGIGDLVDAVSGDATAIERVKSNIPRQFIPLTSLQGWIARIIDPVYRKPETPIESILTGIPGLSTTVGPHTDPDGNPSVRENLLFNAFSPIDVNPVKPEFEGRYQKDQYQRGIRSIEKKVNDGLITPEEGKKAIDEMNSRLLNTRPTSSATPDVIANRVKPQGASVVGKKKSVRKPGKPKTPKISVKKSSRRPVLKIKNNISKPFAFTESKKDKNLPVFRIKRA